MPASATDVMDRAPEGAARARRRPNPQRGLVGAMLASGAAAAVTSSPWLGFLSCVVLATCAAVFAAHVAYPHGTAPSRLRTIVVLGALAYLVGLPTTWLVGRHVGVLTDAHPGLRLLAGIPYAAFVLAFVVESRRLTRGITPDPARDAVRRRS